ncbi:hypothetical protein HAX54_000786 [Datura stramonium]|uniref:Uncharacterized protein n=1 Tax=Datura stramonium TaxID=4076 RepID=A0ABS8WSR1_DATST|nr:hypothetical protein [Datura stramonium]
MKENKMGLLEENKEVKIIQKLASGWTWISNATILLIKAELFDYYGTQTMNVWPDVHVLAVEPYFSDHSPLKVIIDTVHQMRKGRPFRFLTVQIAWNTTQPATKLQSIWEKFKIVKQHLKFLNTREYCGMDKRLDDIRQKLQDVKRGMTSQIILQTVLIEEEKCLKILLRFKKSVSLL